MPRAATHRNPLAVTLLAALALSCGRAQAQHGYLGDWSPDGLMLLFAGADGDRQYVGRYDIATQSAVRVFSADPDARVHAVKWAPDGKSFAVSVTHIEPDGYRAPRARAPKVFLVAHPELTATHLVAPRQEGFSKYAAGTPLWFGGRLLIETPGLLECDFETGKQHAWMRPKGEYRTMLGPFGKSLGYLSMTSRNTWRLGCIPAESLAKATGSARFVDRTHYCDQSIHPTASIQQLPAFAPNRERIALTARAGNERILMLIQHQELVETRALGERNSVYVFDMQWGPRSKTLYVLASRRQDDGSWREALIEWTPLQDGLRATELGRTTTFEGGKRPRTLSIASNRRTAAIVAGTSGDKPCAAFLVDLDDPRRKVTIVDHPLRNHLVLGGSGRLSTLVDDWRARYRTRRIPPVEIADGGSAYGMQQLLERKLDIALTIRRPTREEARIAEDRGLQLVTTRVRDEVLAVCVHPDNPIEAVTRTALRTVFTKGGTHRWSLFAADGDLAGKPVAAAMLLPGSEGYMPFRATVLQRRAPSLQVPTKKSYAEVLRHVQQDETAIACLPLQQALAAGSTVRIVPVRTGNAEPVAATPKTIRLGTYPLLESWFVVHTPDNRRAADFHKWLLAERDKARTGK